MSRHLSLLFASLTLACVGTPEIPFPESSYEDVTPPVGGGARDFSPDNPPWGVLDAVGVVAASIVFMLVTQFVAIVVYILYRGISIAQIGEAITKDPGVILFAILSLIPSHLLTIGLAWVVVTKVGKHPFFGGLGWTWGRGFTLWRCAALAVVLLITCFSIIRFLPSPETDIDRIIASSRAAALATAFFATFTAPFVEEVVYRGVLYSALQRAMSKRWAVAIVILIFAAIHVPQYWPNFGVIGTILVLSFVLTNLRARTGQLLPCFVVHLVFNGIQSILIVLNPYIEHFSPEKTPTPVPAPGALLHFFAQLFTSHF